MTFVKSFVFQVLPKGISFKMFVSEIFVLMIFLNNKKLNSSCNFGDICFKHRLITEVESVLL
jgi:hypothetical protein